jgi:O-antigen ligase
VETRHETGSRRRTREPERGRSACTLIGLAAVVIAAPLLVGSGPSWAQVLSSALVFVVGVVFAVSQRFQVRSVPLAVPAAVAVGMTLAQLVPLPAAAVRWLSPVALDVRTEATGVAPRLLPLTVDVPATIIEACKAAACLVLLLVVAATARRSHRARALLATIAVAGTLVALIHVTQRLIGAHEILGLYRVASLPGGGFFGTFVNGNQAASLFALAALVAAGLAVETEGRSRGMFIASALLCVAVLVATGSRAGAFGLAVAGGAFGALRWSKRYGGKQAAVLAIGAVLLFGAVALAVSEPLRSRLGLNGLDELWEYQKIRGWRAAMRLVGAFPWTGVGRGAFEAPATAFRAHSEGVRLVFPENLILQLTSEWGIPVALLVVAMTLVGASRLRRSLTALEPSVQAAALGVVAVVIHEMADFGLELPGVAFPTMAAIGVVIGRVEGRAAPESRGRLIPRVVVAACFLVWAGALAAGPWATRHTLQADGERARDELRRHELDRSALAAAIARHPADYYLELLAALEGMQRRDSSVGRHLGRAQQLHPGDATVHLTTARWLARAGRQSQAALEYRLAHERGLPVPLEELAVAVGWQRLGDAVRQTAPTLMDAATFLLGRGRLRECQDVSQRAVAAGDHSEAIMTRRLQLARASKLPAFITEAAADLVGGARDVGSYIAAAEAFAAAGQAAAADDAIYKARAAYPLDGHVAIADARVKLGRGDLIGTTTALLPRKGQTFSLEEQVEMDELRAAVAEKRGDPIEAAALRARSRAMSRATIQRSRGDDPL